MDLASIVADAGYVVTLLNLAVKAGMDAAPYAETLYQILVTKAALTDDQRAALQTQEDALRAQLNAPFIPADAA